MIKITPDDVNKTLRETKDKLPKHIKVKGKTLEYGDFIIKFVYSKYGYDDEYGLNFFLRAENRNAKRDEWGNMLEPFNEDNEINFTPRNIRETQQLQALYGRPVYLNKLPGYFAAWNYKDLLLIIPFIICACTDYIDKRNNR